MSKLLLPALRIGYVAAPPAVIDAIAHRVSLTDGMGNALTEDAAAELIENGELRRHGRKVLQIYAKRRQDFAAEIDKTLGDLVDYRMPDGGLRSEEHTSELQSLMTISYAVFCLNKKIQH